MKNLHKEKRTRMCLLSGESLTPDEAKARFNLSRLASVVEKMRKEGIKIHTELVVSPTSTYARYSVIKQKKVSRVKTVLLEKYFKR